MSTKVLLQSWKEISTYTGRTERTLQRWEQKFGFPVHRPAGKARSAVVALAAEIEDWMRSRPSLAELARTAALSTTSIPARAGLIVKNHPRAFLRPLRASASSSEHAVARRRFKFNMVQLASSLKRCGANFQDLCRAIREQSTLCRKIREASGNAKPGFQGCAQHSADPGSLS